MSHRWEFGEEYQQLSSKYRKAIAENDEITVQRVKPRLDELHGIMWQSEVNGFPELAPFSTLAEALEKLCYKNGLPFPDLSDRKKNYTGKGDLRELGRFLFGVGNTKRSIQIMPMEDRGYISIEVYVDGACYKGNTASVEDTAIVLSRWYMLECSIEELHQQFPWMSNEPFKLNGPRVTYK
jgi:hypothetical protein